MSQRDETAGGEREERPRESNGGHEHWQGWFDHQPGYRWRPGREREESPSSRFRGVTEDWEAARGYGGGASELGYGSGRERRYEGRPGGEGGYGVYAADRYAADRYAREGRHGWEAGASQPYYGPRGYWRDRPSWQQNPYGFGQRAHGHENPFDREPLGHWEDPHYYGTGAPGWGGPGFTGGAHAYGGPRYPRRPALEGEYSDESAVSYEQEQEPRRGYGSRSAYGAPYPYGRSGSSTRDRRYPPGPKGYQRSDERLKEDICERLMESHDIDSSEVTVEVRGAKVMLEGTVPSRYMKHAIEDLVDCCSGVRDIDNRVRVASPNYQGSAQGSTPPTAGSGSSSGSSSPNGAKSR